MNNIDERLKKLILKHAKIKFDEGEITDNIDFVKDLGVDSIRAIRFIIDVENEFNFKFEDEYLGLNIIGTYKSLKDYIIKHIKLNN